MRHITSFIISIALLFALVSCATPKGGFVYINVEGDPEALVTIRDEAPILAKDLQNPYDMEPMMQRIKVEWSGIKKTDSQIIDVHYGQTHQADFTAPEKLELALSTEIPASVKMGDTVVGDHKSGKLKYYTGKFVFDVSLDDFDFTFKQSAEIENDRQILIVPGANEKKGSLYIQSDSKETSFSLTCKETPFFHDGSLFVPNISPGVVEIREKSASNIVYYANIFPGQMTKLSFGDTQGNEGQTHNILTPDPNAEISLLVDWQGKGASATTLGKGNLTLTDADFEKAVLIKPLDNKLVDGAKYLVAQTKEKSGFVYASRKFDDKITIELNLTDTAKTKKMPDLLANRSNSISSFDGSMFYDPTQGALVSSRENWAVALNSFVPCDWDYANGKTLCYYRIEGDNTVSLRFIKWGAKETIYLSNHTLSGIPKEKPSYSKTGGFFWKDGKALGLVGTEKYTYLFETSASGSKKLFKFDKACSSAILHGNRYLACEQGLDKSSAFYVIDLENGNTYGDLAYPNITKDGLIVTSFNNIGTTAGAIYKMGNGKLLPVWVGLLTH